MKNETETKKVSRVSPLDIFIAILVVMCIVGVVIRVYVGKDGILPASNNETADYVVSFEIKNAIPELSTYLTSGESLYDSEGNLFGTVSENLTVTPAQIFVEDSEGKYVPVYSSNENDIRGTVMLSGSYADYGFLAGGKTYIAPNYDIELHTGMASFTMKITGISKVQG